MGAEVSGHLLALERPEPLLCCTFRRTSLSGQRFPSRRVTTEDATYAPCLQAVVLWQRVALCPGVPHPNPRGTQTDRVEAGRAGTAVCVLCATLGAQATNQFATLLRLELLSSFVRLPATPSVGSVSTVGVACVGVLV